MSLRKVYGGTPVGAESRCDTCANARIIQGYSESERIVLCGAVYPAIRVPFRVAECSSYEDKRLPNFCDLKEIAWQIRSKSAGHTAGFVLDSELQAKRESESAEEEEPQDILAAVTENE